MFYYFVHIKYIKFKIKNIVIKKRKVWVKKGKEEKNMQRWRGKNNGDERQNKIVKQSKQNGNPKGKGAKNREMLVVMTH